MAINDESKNVITRVFAVNLQGEDSGAPTIQLTGLGGDSPEEGIENIQNFFSENSAVEKLNQLLDTTNDDHSSTSSAGGTVRLVIGGRVFKRDSDGNVSFTGETLELDESSTTDVPNTEQSLLLNGGEFTEEEFTI